MFYSVMKVIAKGVFSVFMPIRAIGRENVPKDGALVLAMNHRSNFDVIAGGLACPRRIHFLAKKELFKGKIASFFLKHLNAIPIDRQKSDIGAIKKSLSVLKGGEILGIFPEGTRVKNGEDTEAKAGVSMLAIRAKVPVVPAAVVGDYGLFRKVYVVFGESISLEEYHNSKQNGEDFLKISASIMEKIKKISDDNKKRLAKGEKLR